MSGEKAEQRQWQPWWLGGDGEEKRKMGKSINKKRVVWSDGGLQGRSGEGRVVVGESIGGLGRDGGQWPRRGGGGREREIERQMDGQRQREREYRRREEWWL